MDSARTRIDTAPEGDGFKYALSREVTPGSEDWTVIEEAVGFESNRAALRAGQQRLSEIINGG